ncbi:hypothetical protein GCM10012285_12570 [Streptomyces kronopolitis]|uniref:Uncharacterized protein n=1 Tax=Streptomyces kronopolitis TaxID=1612435 RepID=A0ABQ2J4M6_9ACTN|nr:hypothetical protein GCM10012285_12570 [Streptomyces kronopolitis]
MTYRGTDDEHRDRPGKAGKPRKAEAARIGHGGGGGRGGGGGQREGAGGPGARVVGRGGRAGDALVHVGVRVLVDVRVDVPSSPASGMRTPRRVGESGKGTARPLPHARTGGGGPPVFRGYPRGAG